MGVIVSLETMGHVEAETTLCNLNNHHLSDTATASSENRDGRSFCRGCEIVATKLPVFFLI